MRHLSRHWPDDYSCEGFLFFAQSVQEMLFDYSIASHKAPALSIIHKIKEAISVIEKVKSGQINDVHVSPVLDELILSLTRDMVVKDILGDRLDGLISDIKNESDKSARIGSLIYLDRAVTGAYPVHCIKLLKRAVEVGRNKREIHDLTKLFCGAMIYFGYSRQFMYFFATEVIRNSNFSGSSALFDDFSSKFNGQSRQYTVYAKVSDEFTIVVNEKEEGKLAIMPIGEYPFGISDADKAKLDEVNGRVLRITVSARDAYSAAELLSATLGYLESCVTFYVHDRKLSWAKHFYVTESLEGEGKLVNLARSEMEKILRVSESRVSLFAKRKLSTAFSTDMPSESADKIISSIVSHSTALKSSRPDTQLVILWSAIETLLPAKERGEKIQYYIEQIIPGLMIGYTRKLFESAFWGFYRSFKKDYLTILKGCAVEGDLVEKMAACLVLNECNEQRRQLQDLASGHPLARFRAQTLTENFSDHQKASKYIKAHKQRLEWQLLRIYRARNSIIHAGENIPNVRAILSNLHEYYDDVSECFDHYLMLSNEHREIGNVFKMMSWDWNFYQRKILNGGPFDINSGNFKKVLGIRKLSRSHELDSLAEI